ncbi:MAG: Mth938-like domain-containing protein [Nevskiaceae bacterium]|jgi:uncharacterized protein|nr:Mth938-like domain-containing protein [Nevskiaceae bacterium]
MKLHEHTRAPIHLVTGYGDGFIQIGAQRHNAPVALSPDQVIAPWIANIAALDAAALAPLWPLAPRILLLGAPPGATANLPALRSLCAEHAAALEPMNLGAACRTYNVLAQEDRPVIALLFP